MSKEVLIFVADGNYAEHVKALMVGCRNEGAWRGDYALIMPDGCDGADFQRRGVDVLYVPDKGFMAKFHVFSSHFRRWEAAFYLDADMLVQGPIQQAFDQLQGTGAEIICHREDMPTLLSWQTWDKDHEQHADLYAQLKAEFPTSMEGRIWNTAWILFRPAAIQEDVVAKLQALQRRFALCNPEGQGGTDQQIIDLLLHDRITQVQDKLFCYWGFDEPQCRCMSRSRGWTGDEVPIMLHYCRWYAPWIKKTPDADAYRIRRLKRVCHELYAENLAAFDATFPATEKEPA